MKLIKDKVKLLALDKAEAKELMPDFAFHFDLFLAQTEEIKQDLNERHNIP